MVFRSAAILYDQFIAWIERFTSGKYWQIKLVLLVFAYVLLVAFPSFDLLQKDFAVDWNILMQQADHPLTPHYYAPESHEAKMAFRLMVPILVHLLHLNMMGVICLQFLAGLLSWLVFIKIMERHTNDVVTTFILTLAMACINFSKCTLDIRGVFFDNIAFLFLLIPFLYPRVVVIFCCIFLAAWVDERALLASSFILLYLIFNRQQKYMLFKIIAVALAWTAYIILRLYLSRTYHLVTPSEGTGFFVLFAQMNNWILGIISGLEGFWILPVLFISYKVKDKNWIDAVLFSGAMLMTMIVALSVADISRSMNYLFISIPLLIAFLAQKENITDLRKIATLVLVFSFLFPAYSFSSIRESYWSYPLPLQLFRMFFM